MKVSGSGGRIAKVTLAEFCEGASCRVRDYPLRVYGRKRKLNAHASDWEGDYNVVFNNCEQFVAWCIMGIGYSEQINTVVAAIMRRKRLRKLQALCCTINTC